MLTDISMKRILPCIALTLTATLLTACSAPPPVDFGSNWQPVNRFQDKPQEVPLSPAYTYYASPLDGTLRGMLRRWANDNAMPLVWQLNSDYTLHKAVAGLRTTALQTAVSELNKMYADQGVYITADIERILVQPQPAASPPNADNTSSAVPAPADSSPELPIVKDVDASRSAKPAAVDVPPVASAVPVPASSASVPAMPLFN